MTDNRTTELLRKLLDERGVKYSDFTSATRNGKAIFKTRWKHERGYAELSEWESTGSNNLFIQNVDPEQVIAATLGNGTCEMEYGGDITPDTARVMGVYFCSECGSPIYNDYMPYFCSYCGKAVKR